MGAYYNENDPFAAAWLRALISAGEIAAGDVDERSIIDVRADDLKGYAQCHFFAGVGGWSYALRLAGWPDDRAVWTGSCPCQPYSAAANKLKKGFKDERDLFPCWFGLVKECRPSRVYGEQVDDSAAWIDRTLNHFENEGFAVAAFDIPACAVDAPNERMRTFFVANADSSRQCKQSWPVAVGSQLMGLERSGRSTFYGDHRTTGELDRIRRVEPSICLLADGISARVGLLRGFGNAINPWVAKEFIEAAEEAMREAR